MKLLCIFPSILFVAEEKKKIEFISQGRIFAVNARQATIVPDSGVHLRQGQILIVRQGENIIGRLLVTAVFDTQVKAHVAMGEGLAKDMPVSIARGMIADSHSQSCTYAND